MVYHNRCVQKIFSSYFTHVIKSIIKQHQNQDIIIDGAELALMPAIFRLCDVKILVTADANVRIERIKNRKVDTDEEISNRVKRQSQFFENHDEYDFIVNTTHLNDYNFNKFGKNNEHLLKINKFLLNKKSQFPFSVARDKSSLACLPKISIKEEQMFQK